MSACSVASWNKPSEDVPRAKCVFLRPELILCKILLCCSELALSVEYLAEWSDS